MDGLALRPTTSRTARLSPDPLPTPEPPSSRRWLPGVAALLFAALLIIPGFAHLSIWLDEGWTIHAAQQPDLSGVMAFVEQDSFPPLDFFALHGWQALLGPDLINFRILGVWTMLLAVAITYRLALDCFGLRAAAAAALLLAASDIVLAFVPFARPYNFYLMLAVLSSWTYWRFTRRYAASWGAAYVVSALLLIYTIYWGGFILIAHGLHALIYHRAALKRLIPVAAAVTLGYLPWL
uniref:glycosyltransferase family 39 protein n=1 Tax=Aggregatilinea sp. TaxID=2806333 RepID=UPI002CF10CF7